METMKKIISHLIVTNVIYWICYLIKSFCEWQFKNPFQWILNIPTYTDEGRGLGLFAYCLSLLFTIPISIGFYSVVFKKEVK